MLFQECSHSLQGNLGSLFFGESVNTGTDIGKSNGRHGVVDGQRHLVSAVGEQFIDLISDGAPAANMKVDYDLGDYIGLWASKEPAIVITSALQTGSTNATATRVESAAYIDGFGRTRETQTHSPTQNKIIVTASLFDDRGNTVTGIEAFTIVDNLDPAKAERFLAIALEEFADHDYAAASVTRIVARAGIAINLALTGAIVLVTILLEVQVLQLFLPHNGTSIAIAAHVNLVASWSFMVMGVTMILSSITRANGATFVPLVIMVLAYIPGRLGVVFVLTPFLGIEALWWSFPISAVCAALMALAYYRWGGWRSARMLPESCMGCPAEVGGQPPAPVAAAIRPAAGGAPAADAGAVVVAAHPAMTFTGGESDIDRMEGCSWALTSPDEVGLVVGQMLVMETGGLPVTVAESHRALYHAALAHGANHLVTLVNDAAEALAASFAVLPGGGVEGDPDGMLGSDAEALARRTLGPLLRAALDNVLASGDAALTGPVMRGDAVTVSRHLDALEDVDAGIAAGYRALALRTADRCGAGRDVTDLLAPDLSEQLR